MNQAQLPAGSRSSEWAMQVGGPALTEAGQGSLGWLEPETRAERMGGGPDLQRAGAAVLQVTPGREKCTSPWDARLGSPGWTGRRGAKSDLEAGVCLAVREVAGDGSGTKRWGQPSHCLLVIEVPGLGVW